MKDVRRDIKDYKALAEQAEDRATEAMQKGQRDIARNYELQAGRYYEMMRKLEAKDKK